MANDHGQRNLTTDVARADAARAAVERALAELRRGSPVMLADPDGNAPAVLVAAAETAEAAVRTLAVAGTVPACVVTAGRAEALGLLPRGRNMTVRPAGESRLVPDASFIAAIAGIEGGTPAADRLAAAPSDQMQDAALELVKLARLVPAAVIARITGDAAGIVRDHDLLTVTTDACARYRDALEDVSLSVATHAPVPLDGAERSEIYAFRPADGGKEHLAIVIGEPEPHEPVLARIHSECFTGDLLGSLRCDCGEQLRGAIRAIAEAGGGVLLYLAQEGRGIGLVNKLRAYKLQDEGFDTIEANERLGFEADERVYRPAAAMLRRLGFTKVKLLTNNPAKVEGLSACGIAVIDRVPHAFPANGHNDRYLRTKASRAGHIL